MFCSKCGNTLSPQGKFCPACGAVRETGNAAPSKRASAPACPLPPHLALPPALDSAASALPPRVFVKPQDEFGLRFAHRNISFGESFSNWTVHPVMGVILAIIIAAGYFGARYMASGISGEPVSGPYSSPSKSFSLEFPVGWREASQPAYRTGYLNTLGFFFKENGRHPSTFMKIFYTSADIGVPKHFSRATLEMNEPYIDKMMQDIKSMEGAEYELLQLSTYMVNGRDALWVEGNEYHEREEPKRDFTFMTFEGNRMYVIVFTMPEKEVEERWLDIEDILSTMQFHDR